LHNPPPFSFFFLKVKEKGRKRKKQEIFEISEFSNIKIGGKAKFLFAPQNLDELKLIIKRVKRTKREILPLGGCSNILFGNIGNRVLILDKNLPKLFEKTGKNAVVVSSNFSINSFIEKTNNRRINYGLG